MNLHVIYLLAVSVVCAFAAAPATKKSAPEKPNNDLKPKREASISSGSGYHGPSYKYLPPSSSASSGGYDSYSSGHHSAFADSAALDFGSLGSSHGSHGNGHFGTSAPKVETYIIQTQSAHGEQDAPHGVSGYRYAGPSSSFGGGYSSHQSGFGSGGYSHGHGAVHKVKAIVIPTRGFSAGSHGGSGYTRFSGSNTNIGYSKGLSGGSHFFSGGSSNHGVSGYAGNSYASKPAQFGGSFGGAHSVRIGAPISHGLQGYEHGSSGIPAVQHSSLEATYRDTDYTGGQGGYSYETPISSHSSHSSSHGIPSSNYGVPVTDLNSQYNAGESAGASVQHSPSYAAGHKGLGHFGYASSRPQALHTDYSDSNDYENSYSGHSSQGHSHIAVKAPFKPSLFLGHSHESGASGSGISSEYGAPAQNHGVSSQYLPPPTSDGYDYPSPSVLYGAPSHGHHSGVEATGPAQEPESAYLPPTQPQTSYGPPSTPGESYLPPHH